MTAYPRTWTYPKGQLGAAAANTMSPDEYATAEENGLLDHHLGCPPRPPATGQLTETDLKHMTPDQICDADDRGQLDHLLGREH